MADRFLRYETLGSIARWLRESGVPTPKDAIRKRNGKPMVGTPWMPATIRHILTNPAVLGAMTTATGPVRDAQGLIIYRAVPLLANNLSEARDKFEKIQARFAQNGTVVRANSTPLLQVAFCAGCGAPTHSTTTRQFRNGQDQVYTYYQCFNARSRNGRCSLKRIKAEPLEEVVFGTLLELAGHRKLRTERLIPGRDYSDESAKLIDQTQHLQAEIGRARLQRKDYSDLQATLDAANAELDRLAALDPEPARLEYDETDQTFQEWWDLHDTTARNAFLRNQGVKVVVSPEPLPEDVALSRPDRIFSVAAIERPGMHAILYMGDLAELLNRGSDLSITVKA